MVLTINSKHVVNFFAINGTVQILTTLPWILFEKNLPSIYCSYKFYEYRGNPSYRRRTVGHHTWCNVFSVVFLDKKKLLSCVSKQTFVCGQDTAFWIFIHSVCKKLIFSLITFMQRSINLLRRALKENTKYCSIKRAVYHAGFSIK